jgi:hypothetical protein
MFHQIRQPIRARDIGRTKAQQMQLHRAMRAHGAPCGSGAAWCQVNFSIRPRHQPAQPKPKRQAGRISFRPAARSG